MFKINKNPSILVCSAMTLMLGLALANPASASTWSKADALGLIESSYPTAAAQASKISQFKSETATAETISQAREMALNCTDMAIEALKNANTICRSAMIYVKDKTRCNQPLENQAVGHHSARE